MISSLVQNNNTHRNPDQPSSTEGRITQTEDTHHLLRALSLTLLVNLFFPPVFYESYVRVCVRPSPKKAGMCASLCHWCVFPSAILTSPSTWAILQKNLRQEQKQWVDRWRKSVTFSKLKDVTATFQPVAYLCSRKVWAYRKVSQQLCYTAVGGTKAADTYSH